jgi:putative Ca2+/H+ antiporter (TMEM165/GDT1 family)
LKLTEKLQNLDWKLILKVFGVVWLSEMGDKTQVTTLFLAGAKPLYVLWVALGSASALVTTSLIEITIGSAVVARFLRPRMIKLASSTVFIILGILLLCGVIGRIEL